MSASVEISPCHSSLPASAAGQCQSRTSLRTQTPSWQYHHLIHRRLQLSETRNVSQHLSAMWAEFTLHDIITSYVKYAPFLRRRVSR